MTDHYVREALIGHGSFGEVWRAVERDTGRTYAIKLVDLEAIDEQIEIIQREIHLMCQLDTPYVVRYHTSYVEGSTLYIVMEYMPSGSLKELMQVVGRLPEEACAYVAFNILSGLAYIHSEGKLHRDVKSANILLSPHEDVKLADFGVAASVAGTMRKRNTCVGSPFYMAPEVIQVSSYSTEADIWSFGITLIELATGSPPLANLHPFRAMMVIPKNDAPRLQGGEFSGDFKEFVAACLRKDPSQRPTAAELLGHRFLERARKGPLKELIAKKDTIESMRSLSLERSKVPPKPPPNGPLVKKPSVQSTWDFDSEADAGREIPVQEDKINEHGIKAKNVARNTQAPKIETTGGSPMRSSNGVSASQRPHAATNEPKYSDSAFGKGTKRAERETSREKSAGSERIESSPTSAVLTEVILPVLSTIRGNLAAKASGKGDSLLQLLGNLEVAFVHTEQAHPGISNVLLESLFKEALVSQSPEVRAVLMSALKMTSGKK